MKHKVLIVDDDEAIRTQMKWALSQDYDMCFAEDRRGALEAFEASAPAVTLLDLGLPPRPNECDEGLAALSSILAIDSTAKVIVISGQSEKRNALQAVGAGAYDFLCKPVDVEELKLLLRRCIYVVELEREYRELQQGQRSDVFEDMLGTSPQMQSVFAFIRKVAGTNAPVLLLGESGTGKEMAAAAIHHRSARKDGPFVAINCNAIPENLLESELFGHEKGAFTGAIAAKPGLIDLADGGTLLLDEIGEMEPDSQVKLLRALETGMFFRVGSTRSRTVDVRIVASTNRDLAEAMKSGEFRQDLYYRINTITVTLPPLRERPEDVALLAQHFVEANAAYGAKRLGPAALAALEAYAWPGNVRELLHAIERAVILSRRDEIQPDDLPPEVLGAAATPPAPGVAGGSLETMERQHIVATLRQVAGHRGKAAALLAIDPKTLYRKINGYQIRPEEFR